MRKRTSFNNFQSVEFHVSQGVAVIESVPFNFSDTPHVPYPPQRRAAIECPSFYFLEFIVALHFGQLCTTSECPLRNCVDRFSNPHSLHITGNTLLSSRVHKNIIAII